MNRIRECFTTVARSGGFDSSDQGGGSMLKGRGWVSWLFLIVMFVCAVLTAAQKQKGLPADLPSASELPTEALSRRLGKPGAREAMASKMAEDHRRAKQAAWEVAFSQGRQPLGLSGNTYYELMAIRGGLVYVLKTLNVNAAISTAVDAIRDMPPYDLSGAGQIVGVWDAGSARVSHQEFLGRVSIGDGSEAFDHSTHVTGTIAAVGKKILAQGMAPSARVETYDFDEDLAEVAQRAMSYANEPNMIQISNHSYGWTVGWDYTVFFPVWYGTWGNRESDMFGRYEASARDWDALCYAAPYYLPFKACGNDRADTVPIPGTLFDYYTEADEWQSKEYSLNTDPYPDAWDQGGYDTISPDATAKNVVTVGAINMAGDRGRDLDTVRMTDFSSWGPTDDGRVKPDLVAHGVDLYSTMASTDHSYDVSSGTSMATPAASGAAVLLLEYYARLFPGQVMRSATIKALLIHTADDLGNPGPDYNYGWGLINAQVAVEHIQEKFDFPDAGRMVEDVLDLSSPTRSYPFFWDGNSPIRATLVWTDPPGAEIEGLDNPTPCLVNDLDVRVIGPEGTIHAPFAPNPSRPADPAGVGDNVRDNVEQVWIETPLAAGQYLVEVTYKGTLVDKRQEYSLLLSGQQLSETVVADPNGITEP